MNTLQLAFNFMLYKGGEDAFVKDPKHLFEDRRGFPLYDKNDPDVCRYCLLGAIDAADLLELADDAEDQLLARIAVLEKEHIDDAPSPTRWLHEHGPKAALDLLAMEDVDIGGY